MNKEEHKQEVIKNLKAISESVQNTLYAFYADQLEYKHAEDSMNYIRLCTQKVQLHLKNCVDTPCHTEPFMIDSLNDTIERIRRQLTKKPE